MANLPELTPQLIQARARWRYRGLERPPFADATGPGDESVWDFPRPPRQEDVISPLRVLHGEITVAATDQGLRVLETAGAPTYYFPAEDVVADMLVDLPGQTTCEWKGFATSFALAGQADSCAVGWRYDITFPEFSSIRHWSAFYPGVLSCYIGDEQVQPQPGGYYGGWVTGNLMGPIKGEPNSHDW